jgi:hypothetical protein
MTRRSAWFTHVLGFTLVADTYQPEQGKRWVLVAPPGVGDNAATLLLARASSPRRRPSSAIWSCGPSLRPLRYAGICRTMLRPVLCTA